LHGCADSRIGGIAFTDPATRVPRSLLVGPRFDPDEFARIVQYRSAG